MLVGEDKNHCLYPNAMETSGFFIAKGSSRLKVNISPLRLTDSNLEIRLLILEKFKVSIG